jgi:Cytochrome c
MRTTLLMLAIIVIIAAPARAQEPDAIERGRKALLTRAFTPAVWTLESYDQAWKQWLPQPKEKPAHYDQAFKDYYGLHTAPFASDYPMGLRVGSRIFGKGVTTDCLLCHGGSIAGQSYIGLGNASLDVHALFQDMTKASGIDKNLPFTFSNARGTSEAGNMAVYLLAHRDESLKILLKPLDLGLRENLCEDVPAWWHLKKKKTMYHTGNTNSRSVRSLMQFALSPPNSAEFFNREEATFRDIQAFLLSLTPPKYPLSIDHALAAKGQEIFNQTCAKCHGHYGENWTYPNKIVAIEEVGTDRTRLQGFTKAWADHYNHSWFARETEGDIDGSVKPAAGYLAPPLDGIWATAPYFHNGSAPTVYDVLNSKTRPKIFTRSFKTDLESYDSTKLGWKVSILERGPDPALPAIERRKVYDTTQPGRGNGGHTFGDELTERERRAVIEYLKTL